MTNVATIIKPIEKWAFLLFSMALFVYIILRAVLVHMVMDEATTFYIYVQNGEFLPFQGYLDANNHLLNSFLESFSYQLFGASNLALRLPNVLATLLFIWGVWRIFQKINLLPLRCFFVLTLYTTSFFIEFFALGRGYGLSMGLMVLGLSFFTDRYRLKSIVFSTGFISLSVLANLTIIPLLLLVIGWWAIQLMLENNASSPFKNWIAIALTGILPAAFCIYYSMVLKEAGALYLGDSNGFIQDTLGSLNLELFSTSKNWIAYFEIGVFVVLIVQLCYNSFQQGFVKWLTDYRHLYLLLLLGAVISIFLQHYIMGINFPQERSVVYFIPLFLISLIIGVEQLPQPYQVPLSIVTLVLALIFPYKFMGMVNLNHLNYSYWKTEYIPQQFVTAYQNLEQELQRPPTLSGYFTKSASWSKLAFDENVSRSPMLYENYPNTLADLLWIKKEHNTSELTKTHEIIYDDPVSSMLLFKRKQPAQETLVLDTTYRFNDLSTSEFFNLWEVFPDSSSQWIGKKLRLEYEMDVEAKDLPFQPLIIASENGKDGEVLFYDKCPIAHYLNFKKQPKQKIKISFFFGPISPDAQRFVTYIWNLNQRPGSASGNLKVYNFN
tara:strand:+ start:16715 stop:18538 length:1824 start_codon:yes stop_codon:yes gene_type:complete